MFNYRYYNKESIIKQINQDITEILLYTQNTKIEFYKTCSLFFQIGGVRFLYDNLVESLSRFKSSPGFGCILAHSMGLGKTIQMISLIDVLLRYTSAKSVLLIVPINTLQNWLSEINMWCPEFVPEGFPDVQLREFKCYILNDNFKTPVARAKVIGTLNHI